MFLFLCFLAKKIRIAALTVVLLILHELLDVSSLPFNQFSTRNRELVLHTAVPPLEPL